MCKTTSQSNNRKEVWVKFGHFLIFKLNSDLKNVSKIKQLSHFFNETVYGVITGEYYTVFLHSSVRRLLDILSLFLEIWNVCI